MQTRTWGPFTGRQLTTMFCVTIVTLLLPVAAWSASASHVVVDSGKITVASPVAANVAQRSQFVSTPGFRILPSNGVAVVILTPPAGKGLVITAVHGAWISAPMGSFLHLFVGNASCTSNELFIQDWTLAQAGGNFDSPIAPGYVVPPGKTLCAHANTEVLVNAYGYAFAAGDVPTPHLDPAASLPAGHP
jgi:hypothetical protein